MNLSSFPSHHPLFNIHVLLHWLIWLIQTLNNGSLMSILPDIYFIYLLLIFNGNASRASTYHKMLAVKLEKNHLYHVVKNFFCCKCCFTGNLFSFLI